MDPNMIDHTAVVLEVAMPFGIEDEGAAPARLRVALDHIMDFMVEGVIHPGWKYTRCVPVELHDGLPIA